MSGAAEAVDAELAWIRISGFAIGLGLFGQAVLVPVAMQGRGEPASWIGLVVGILSLALVAGRLGSGGAIDRFGSRPFLVWGAAAFAATSFLMMVWSDRLLYLGCRVVQGMALAGFTSASVARVAGVATARGRTTEMSRWWVSFSVAAVVGPAAAGWVVARAGLDVAFGLTGAAALSASIIAALALPRRVLPSVSSRLRFVSRAALLPAVVAFATGVAAGAFLMFAPLHAIALGMSNPGLYLAANAAGMISGQLGLGAVAARSGRSRALVPALAVGAVVTVLVGFAELVPVALGLSFLFGLTISGISPILTAWAIDRAPADERGTATSTSIAARELGGFAGAAALGLMLGPWGAGASWSIVGGIVAVGAAVYLTRGRRAGAEELAGAAAG